MSTDAEPSIRNTRPIFQIVTAFKARPGPIGDFIVHETGLVQRLRCFDIKGGEDIIVRKGGRIFPPHTALFDIEHINRNMLRLEAFDPVQVFPPDFQPLVRQAGNQIDTDVAESMFSETVEISKYIGSAVDSTRILQIPVIERLHTEADSIDTGSAVLLQFVSSQRAGIGFQTDFASAFWKRADNLLD